jgi:hypothetical protein
MKHPQSPNQKPLKGDSMTISFEDVIKFLFVGGRIDGVRFGPVPQLLITNSDQNILELRGQIYLNLASRWCVFNRKPSNFPKNEGDIPKVNELEELLMIIELRNKTIINGTIFKETSGLILEFADGSIFYMHGTNEKYESWDAGVAFNAMDEHWQVISMPGGELAGMIPNKYLKKFTSNS